MCGGHTSGCVSRIFTIDTGSPQYPQGYPQAVPKETVSDRDSQPGYSHSFVIRAYWSESGPKYVGSKTAGEHPPDQPGPKLHLCNSYGKVKAIRTSREHSCWLEDQRVGWLSATSRSKKAWTGLPEVFPPRLTPCTSGNWRYQTTASVTRGSVEKLIASAFTCSVRRCHSIPRWRSTPEPRPWNHVSLLVVAGALLVVHRPRPSLGVRFRLLNPHGYAIGTTTIRCEVISSLATSYWWLSPVRLTGVGRLNQLQPESELGGRCEGRVGPGTADRKPRRLMPPAEVARANKPRRETESSETHIPTQ